MKISVGGRACGKTTRAVEWLLEDSKRLLAVFGENEKRRIIKQFNIHPSKIIVWNKMTADISYSDREIGIDNAEWLIQELFKNHVGKVWMTGEYAKEFPTEPLTPELLKDERKD